MFNLNNNNNNLHLRCYKVVLAITIPPRTRQSIRLGDTDNDDPAKKNIICIYTPHHRKIKNGTQGRMFS